MSNSTTTQEGATMRPNVEDLQAAAPGATVTFARNGGPEKVGTLHGTRRETGYFYAEVIYFARNGAEIRDLVYHADIVRLEA